MKLYKYTFYNNLIKEDIYDINKNCCGLCVSGDLEVCKTKKINSDVLSDGHTKENGHTRYNSGWCYSERKSLDYMKNVLVKFYKSKIEYEKLSYKRVINDFNNKIDLINGFDEIER